ncbi:hypothetical protein FB451DRAFT_1290193 [Mycena latifolia]|nr:hypothetical protein FB451DRAFT_1290193 [Mycena latifolia]
MSDHPWCPLHRRNLPRTCNKLFGALTTSSRGGVCLTFMSGHPCSSRNHRQLETNHSGHPMRTNDPSVKHGDHASVSCNPHFPYIPLFHSWQPSIHCPFFSASSYLMDTRRAISTAEGRISPGADASEQSAAVDNNCCLWYKAYPFPSTRDQLAEQPKMYLDETNFLLLRNFPVIAVEDLGDYFARDALVRQGPGGSGRLVWWAPPRIILLSDGKLRNMPRLHTDSHFDICQALPSSREEMVEVMAEIRAELQQISASLD